jgi:predicted DNA-binding transcriptional regulator YafY
MTEYGIFIEMTDSVARWERLERLRGLLSRGEPATVAHLAEALNVSPRTMMRDLDALRDMGVLVEADRGRGGGVRIAAGHGQGRITLAPEEAIDLLVAIALAEKLASPLRRENLIGARQKLASAFAQSHRETIRMLRRRVLVGSAASSRVAAEFAPQRARHNEALRSAFFQRRLLALAYRDERGRETSRVVEAQYLLLNPPAWYVLAWDHMRESVRAFRTDRIVSASLLSERFPLRAAGPFLEAAERSAETL